jgi:hypothetical protein
VRRLSILVAVVVAAAVAVPAAAPKGPVLVGIVGKQVLYQELARFDATTLQPLPGRVPLAAHRSGWSFSPDNATLVLGDDNESCTSGSTTLRFVDLAAMKVLDDVPVVKNGPVTATAWLDRRHVVTVVSAGDCIVETKTVVASIDAGTRRVVKSTTLAGDALHVARAAGRLVLLLGPLRGIGTARLAVVDGAGNVRQTDLAEIRAGTRTGGPDRPYATVQHPGLAVDPAGGRAFVVPAGDRLAEIDLATLRVSYRDTSEQRSTFARFRDWLDPPASAKGLNAPARQALWLGNGKLAVTGADSADNADHMSATAAGLRIVDTRNWTYRKLDGAISSVRLGGGLLLATGSSYRIDGDERQETNAGLVA